MNRPMKSEVVTGNWRKHVDSRTISAEDFLPGQEREVTVERVTKEEVADMNSREKDATTTMITLHFVGVERFMPMNKTNLRAVARICGSNNVADWVGKSVILFRSEEVFFGVPGCLRFRKVGSPRNKHQAPPPAKGTQKEGGSNAPTDAADRSA